MRLVDSFLCESVSESNPIENASVNATNSKVSWRFALVFRKFPLPIRSFVFASTVALTAIVSSQSCLASSAKTESVRAYLIKQDSEFIGPHELCVSQNALRSTDLNTGIITLVTAGDRKVVVFNGKKKCFFQTKIDTMGMDPTVSPFTPYRFALANRKWTQHKKFAFEGENIVVYESVQDPSKQIGKGWSKGDGIDINKARYAEAPGIKVSSALLKSLEYLYVIPPPKALPVRLLIFTGHNKPVIKIVLKTISIERKTLPLSYFSVPNGYKQVSNRREVGDYAKRDAVLESVTDLIMEHK